MSQTIHMSGTPIRIIRSTQKYHILFPIWLIKIIDVIWSKILISITIVGELRGKQVTSGYSVLHVKSEIFTLPSYRIISYTTTSSLEAMIQ